MILIGQEVDGVIVEIEAIYFATKALNLEK